MYTVHFVTHIMRHAIHKTYKYHKCCNQAQKKNHTKSNISTLGLKMINKKKLTKSIRPKPKNNILYVYGLL